MRWKCGAGGIDTLKSIPKNLAEIVVFGDAFLLDYAPFSLIESKKRVSTCMEESRSIRRNLSLSVQTQSVNPLFFPWESHRIASGDTATKMCSFHSWKWKTRFFPQQFKAAISDISYFNVAWIVLSDKFVFLHYTRYWRSLTELAVPNRRQSTRGFADLARLERAS